MNIIQKMKFNSLKKKVEKYNRLREEGDNTAAKREVDAQIELGKFYDQHLYDKAIPNANLLAQECFRAAALLGNANAQYIVADKLIKLGNFWEDLNKTLYQTPAYERYYSLYYEEALSFIKQAIAQGHPLAKRLYGMAHFKGWGVKKDSEMGAKLIIESIKEEGTWDKANKIFEELGLHSPDIFASLMAQSKKMKES